MIKTTRKKRVSKKLKSSWRKHSDIKDIDEFLEEERQNERIGNFSDKQDEDLFTIDAKANAKLLLSAKERRKLNAAKPPKNLTSLINTSAVKDPLVQRNKVKQRKSGRNILQEVINPTTQKHIQANKDRSNYHVKLEKKIGDTRKRTFNKDVWDDRDYVELKEFQNQEWVSRNLALHHLKNTGRILAKLPKKIREKTTVLRSIEKPHPGTSYNPSLKDHQKLVEKVIVKESKIIKEEKHLKRVTTDMFSKVTAEERDLEKFKELDNKETEEEIHETKDINENIYQAINPPVQIKKKDKKFRRRRQEQIKIDREIKKKKIEKKKIVDINKLKKLEEEVLDDEKNKIEAKKRKKIIIKKKKFEPKRLGKLKYEEPNIDFNDANNISGNLRNVKTESSLLVDRYKKLQKRNILPVSVDVGVRKRRKIKRFVRSSHKEPQQKLSSNKKSQK